MEFYRILAKAYDEVFPFSETTFGFLRKYAGTSVLDVGCATGAYVKRFHEEGCEAEGIEYVPELMKYRINISAGDMRRLPESFSGRFSLVYCIGNTLAHCTDAEDARSILSGFARSLKDGGTAVIQILNYAGILEKRPAELPLIETEGVRFKREYRYTDGRIEFIGSLTAGGQAYSSSVMLYPLTHTELSEAAVKAGFSSCVHYGDFAGTPFNEAESFMLVSVLGK
ncbi:class I SAM-dependent methyltransferase [Geovibrio thiophilus]|uniref:Class I SAM-dependent methyltransferase n=1 Tax=Geovibrio thiophilus TaxID=139438 RepID=A0A3R5X1Y1_9BACT|nr:class I SAM-dependent methyltransferase [Geovibrio thiophilus]QAR32488.1 class I SAM-dependent methyltransferase [Geovibrio thiophilus]